MGIGSLNRRNRAVTRSFYTRLVNHPPYVWLRRLFPRCHRLLRASCDENRDAARFALEIYAGSMNVACIPRIPCTEC